MQADPRSPEHGQYGFLQDLVRHVAYETLSKRERRAQAPRGRRGPERSLCRRRGRGRRGRSHPTTSPPTRPLPDAEDAGEIKRKAQAMLVRAASARRRSRRPRRRSRYFEQAAELARDTVRAGGAARSRRRYGRAGRGSGLGAPALRQSRSSCTSSMATRMPPPVFSWRLGRLDCFTGRRDEAMARMERAFAVLSADEPDEDLALLAARLALAYWYSGDLERAAERAELALGIAEAHAYPAALSSHCRRRARSPRAVATSRGRWALVKDALADCARRRSRRGGEQRATSSSPT